MPIYEYQCPSCEKVFEEWARTANDEEEKACPKCGGVAHRMISNTAFILKGGGWYVTDYGYRKGVSEDGNAGAGGGAVKPEGGESSSAAAAGSSSPAGTGSAKSVDSGSGKSADSGQSSGSAKSADSGSSGNSSPASAQSMGATGS